MQRWMKRSIDPGTIVRKVEIGGGSDARIAAIRVAWFWPLNAGLPVVISYRMVPSAKISLRESASLPSNCSGAMYWKVPRIIPSWVRRVDSAVRSSSEASAREERFSNRASPKSSSLAPDFVSMTFPGFRSRCTMPLPCAVPKASAIS